MATSLEILKFNLQEKQSPYFDDADLTLLLEKYSDDVNAASYEGCLLKAQNDAIKLGALSTESNENYWLRLADRFKSAITSSTSLTILGLSNNAYKTSMKRSDGQ